MSAYYELLNNNNEDKATNFLIETITNIYQNPTHKINSNSKNTMIDYVFDFFKELKNIFWKTNISLPDINLKGNIWDYALEIKKDIR